MADRYVQVASLLIDLECELRQLSMWRSEPPAAEAFASTEPFSIDTMSLAEWLQFVFMVRMSLLVEQRASLPGPCAITPYAEQDPELQKASKLLAVLAKLDAVLDEPWP